MNNKRLKPVISLIAIAAMVMMSTFAFAASKAELKDKFEKRYPQLLDYKKAGKIGETYLGTIEAVKKDDLSDKKLSSLLDDENSDRKELYRIIASEEKTSVDEVARAAAVRNAQKAKSGEYLKDKDGVWKKKP